MYVRLYMQVCICICLCMYVRMYECMYVFMYVCMYVDVVSESDALFWRQKNTSSDRHTNMQLDPQSVGMLAMCKCVSVFYTHNHTKSHTHKHTHIRVRCKDKRTCDNPKRKPRCSSQAGSPRKNKKNHFHNALSITIFSPIAATIRIYKKRWVLLLLITSVVRIIHGRTFLDCLRPVEKHTISFLARRKAVGVLRAPKIIIAYRECLTWTSSIWCWDHA